MNSRTTSQVLEYARGKFNWATLFLALLGVMAIVGGLHAKNVPNWRKEYDAAVAARYHGHFDDFKTHCQKALQLIGKESNPRDRNEYDEPSAWVEGLIQTSADDYRRNHKYKQAEEMNCLLLPNEIQSCKSDDDPQEAYLGVASLYAKLGSICLNDKRLAQAENYYRSSISNFKLAGSAKDDECIDATNSLALCLEEQNKLSKAEDIYKQLASNCLRAKETATGFSGTYTLLSYADFLKRHKRTAEAAKISRTVKAYFSNSILEEDVPQCFDEMVTENADQGAVVESKRIERLLPQVRSLFNAKRSLDS